MISEKLNSEIDSNINLSSKEFFEKFSSKHSWEPGWLADSRKDSWERLQSANQVSVKDERWRFSPKSRFGYTNFNQIAEAQHSIKFNGVTEESGITVDSIDSILLEQPDVLTDFVNSSGPNLGATESFQLINSYFNNGLFIKVDKNQSQALNLTVDHYCPAVNQATFHRNFIILGDFTELTIIENFTSKDTQSSGALSNLTNFILGKGAKLRRVLIQNLGNGSSFHNLENFILNADSSVVNVECYLGGSQSRIETKGNLTGKGANFENYSFVSGKNEQLFDQRTEQHHIAPHCSSNLLSKNVLQEEAKSIFAGLIRVDKEAQQTNALQTNRNLVLTKEAEADSLPGLEILANDVKCTHGATTSRLDQEELFYLLSRGIDKKTAESLISLGFLEEIISKVPKEETSTKVRDIVSSHFNKS